MRALSASSPRGEAAHLDGVEGGGWRAPARRVWTRLFKAGLIDHGGEDISATHHRFCDKHDEEEERLCAVYHGAHVYVITPAGLDRIGRKK